MRLLLDTHALLWWLNDDEKLGNHARGLIGDPENDVLLSAVSLWEITVKLRIGKLDADIEEILAILPGRGFDRLDITDAHLIALTALPLHHRDPFDHLLMAQSVAEGAHFVSQDQNVAHHGIPFVTCSDPVVS
ncbi:type II toxin-antitoxin system VapC family toxin (plasmid) [Sinorhizobium meliloti]|uniref:type II toxin-antitoxin system VapC family toxin n=1 Tax=Rhizobium meliloti TaxID=382 RepID=UPI0002FEABB0|nr:type II toxin-antitoxin system VapC family toxin [Sinorhizobium meliloti]MDE3876371.1 type II toxin-antitoxin system VapC family toxin [Sinorhizobium meliloti]MDW9365763.1 type II toxin-antitoxin system VapC family toxin [Sinorhizobium meliloti]MDW9412002.1 PIN domain-containing protein [Sinorhizobium meliloti]MDW9457559.1 PIN domain-containing protein [Sinorhizobium meliloti]MDW9470068.1 PIN domain-containing protein [Sinorhizobium meliloti]